MSLFFFWGGGEGKIYCHFKWGHCVDFHNSSRECKKALRSKFMSSGKKNKSVIHGHLLSRYDQVPF